MEIATILYYAGFVTAIFVCRGLGPIFYIPMTLDLIFNIVLQSGGLQGWDVRLVVLTSGILWFIWVMALAGTLNKGLIVLLILVDLAALLKGVEPQLAAVGSGDPFWHLTSTKIIEVWMLSVLVVVLFMVVKSTLVARLNGEFVDLLSNPRKRFLIPIGLHAAVWVIAPYLESVVPAWLFARRYDIAAQVLVWGWVAIELPFFIMYRRLKRQYT